MSGQFLYRRRELLAALAAATALPPGSRAPLIGFLGATSPASSGWAFSAFLRGLAEAEFADGRNVAVESRWAEGRYDRLPAMAAQQIGRHPRVIVAATLPAALAAKAATREVPVVFFSGGDPVQQGLVGSFAHPGGNLTGVCVFLNDLGPKRLELLLELTPKARVIGFLVNPDNPNAEYQTAGMQRAAQAGGRQVVVLGARSAAEIDAAFAGLADRHGEGLVVGADPFLGSEEARVAALAARYRLPAVATGRRFAQAGGVIAYGNDVDDAYRHVGRYTGRVLKGEKPADLPVERATKFELFVNRAAATALGLEVPPRLLAQADEVIE